MPTVNTVFLTYTTLGSYLKDFNNIKGDFPDNAKKVQSTLEALLADLITEYQAMDNLKAFDLNLTKRIITKGYDHCVNKRRELEAVQAAEDIAYATAIAAEVALAATSWTVVGAIGLGITTIATEAAALGIDMEVQHLENSMPQVIADMGLKVKDEPTLANLKTYQDASDKVTMQIPILELGGNKATVRQSLLGLAKASGTVKEMKNMLIHFYDAYNDSRDIIGKYKLLAELMIKGDGGADAQAIVRDLKGIGVAASNISYLVLAISGAGFTTTYMLRRFTKQIAQMFEDELVMSIEDISLVAQLSSKAATASKCVKGLAVLGATLEAAVLVLSIIDQRKIIDNINEQIEQRKNDLVTYYTTFHDAVTREETPAGDVIVNVNAHHKVIKPNGEFWVAGKLLGNGKWVTATRFVVFVEAWAGGLWWVGDLVSGGMNTATIKTEADVPKTHPSHFEKFTG